MSLFLYENEMENKVNMSEASSGKKVSSFSNLSLYSSLGIFKANLDIFNNKKRIFHYGGPFFIPSEHQSYSYRTLLRLTLVKDTFAKVVIIGVPAPFTATCTNQARSHSKSRFNICFENQVSPFHFCIESTLL